MEKRSNMGSSVYTDLSHKPSNQLDPKIRSKPRIKIQIVNQNLEDAIRDVRSQIKENPEWNLNVKRVVQQYAQPRQRHSIVNQTLQDREGNQLPQSAKQPPLSSHFEPSKGPDLQKLKYTERQKREYEQRMVQLKEKRMQLEVNSLQKQMRAKLEKKIKENLLLKEKARIVRDIQEEREQRVKLRDKASIKKNQEQSLLHQSNAANVDMLRRYRNKIKKRQLTENHSKSEQSALELRYREFLNEQQKCERKDILVARYRALRTASQGSLRTKIMQKRTINTALSAKRQRGRPSHELANDIYHP